MGTTRISATIDRKSAMLLASLAKHSHFRGRATIVEVAIEQFIEGLEPEERALLDEPGISQGEMDRRIAELWRGRGKSVRRMPRDTDDSESDTYDAEDEDDEEDDDEE